MIANLYEVAKGVVAGPDYVRDALFGNFAISRETLHRAGGIIIEPEFGSRIEMLKGPGRQICWPAKRSRHAGVCVCPNLLGMARQTRCLDRGGTQDMAIPNKNGQESEKLCDSRKNSADSLSAPALCHPAPDADN
jgi:hypothetical protein